MSYDHWKTTEPAPLDLDLDQYFCPQCSGAGRGRNEDGPWQCPTCCGRGWLWGEEIDEAREVEQDLWKSSGEVR